MLMAFTGAGISAASGVLTFQNQEGIRDRLTRSFAQTHPKEYQDTIDQMWRACQAAEPNDAHLALAEYDIPIITMNVDGLHQRAGSKHVLPIHGNLSDGTIVLYGDPAPFYSEAESWVYRMQPGDIFLIIGTSYYTEISLRLKRMAYRVGADVIEINASAETMVRKELEAHSDCFGSFEEFMERTEDTIIPPLNRPYGSDPLV